MARWLPRAAALLAACHLGFSATPSLAQQSVPIVRDAEIEALMRDYAQPILKAAGLERSGIQIILVNDNSFNAFVAGRRMFFNTGALLTAETPNEIIGVIAHEAGHLAGGHQERLRQQLDRAQTIAIVGALLGVGIGVAGAASGVRGLGSAGAGLAMSAPEVARRGLLSYQRGEEAIADRSALTYLEATGQSPRGMLKTFERLSGSLTLSGIRLDPYQQSHPTPRERVANLQAVAQASPYFERSDPAALQQRHDMMRAKVAAYTMGQGAVQRMFRDNPGGIGALYGDAIGTYLYGNPASALTKTDALLRQQPSNPYLHELRGEILMKANRPADAASAFAKAIALDPDRTGLLHVLHGQALLAVGQPDSVRLAVSSLKHGLDRDPEYVTGYRYLAQAYGMTGDIGLAELATAEGHFQAGQYRDAKIFAARSQQKVRRGSPPWVRAQDIINFNPPN